MRESIQNRRTSRRAFLSGHELHAVPGEPAWKPPNIKDGSYSRIVGANERIRLGVIGTGGMGTTQLGMLVRNDRLAKERNCEVSAVCDVHRGRREHAAGVCRGKEFLNYQDLLTSGLVDGVIITTPEHWHSRIALDALACRLDVYCQKPMTKTFAQARDVYHAFRKSDRVFQLGTQGVQSPVNRKARELYLKHKDQLGPRVLAQTSACRNSRDGEWNYGIDSGLRPGPDLDWVRFMGPLPYEEYNPEYFFRWRKFRQFSAGPISDLLAHVIAYITFAMGGPDVPRSVSCVGGIYAHPDRTVPDSTLVTVDYGGYLLLLWSTTANAGRLPDLVRCHGGNLYVDDPHGHVRIVPQRGIGSPDFRQADQEAPGAEDDLHVLHMAEFLDCMRSRKATTCDIETAWRGMAAIAMAEEACWSGRAVHLDGEHLRLA